MSQSLLGVDTNYRPNMGIVYANLKIKEVYDTTQYNYDVHNTYQYQGTIQGGIVQLLQNNWSRSTPHIRFLNAPPRKRYVYFHGEGLNMSSTKFKGDKENNMQAKITQTLGKNPQNAAHVDGREIIMNVLKQQFEFEIETVMDSLDVVSLVVIDSHKMNQFIIAWEKVGYECQANKDRSIPKPNFCTNSLMLFVSYILEETWNVYVEDRTNTYPLQFFFQYPSHFFESFQKFEVFNTFVSANYGFALTKRKELRPVYCIKFL